MATKDYYKILGLNKDASQDEIKSAYRQLAKKYHPDLHPNDAVSAEKFKDVNEAYSVLGDPDKRRRYDLGGIGFANMDGNEEFEEEFTATGFDDIFDIFSGVFGGGSRRTARSTAQNGTDVTQHVKLTFMEAALGCEKKISFTRMEKCPTCGGTGAKTISSIKTCDKCGGTGQLRYKHNTVFGHQITIGACNKCGGTGSIVTENCPTCNGKGLVSKDKIMSVTIPAGVENSTVLQLSGQGNSPKGNGANGNLMLVMDISPSKVFKREGLDLYVELPVDLLTAVFGGEIAIPCLEGVFYHRLPEAVGNGDVLRFRGRGIQSGRGNVGDLFVTIKVEVPRNVSRSQRQLLEQFTKTLDLKNYPKKKEFMENVTKMCKENNFDTM